MKKHTETLNRSSGSMPKGNEPKTSRTVATGNSGKHNTKNKPGMKSRKFKADCCNG
jgi:hypothetical protein